MAMVGLAGCIEDGTGAILDDGSTEMVAKDMSIFSGTNCVEAGGVSTYLRDEGDTVGPFETENTAPHIGDPVIGTWVGGTPGYTMASGNSQGIWHMAVKCPDYTIGGELRQGMDYGWVAYMIKQPTFDTTPGIAKHFLVADLSISDVDVVDLLRTATGGAEISRSFGATIAKEGPITRAYLDDENHGVFGSDIVLESSPFGTKESEVIRFWMLVPVAADGHGHDEEMAGPIPGIPGESSSSEDTMMYRPVAFDMVDTSANPAGRFDGPAGFTHTDNENHGNSVGAGGNVHGVFWDGFDREFRWVDVPAGVYFDNTWTH